MTLSCLLKAFTSPIPEGQFILMDMSGSGGGQFREWKGQWGLPFIWTALHTYGARLEVLYEKHDFRRYQSGQPTVFSGTYIITVPQYVYTWLILQFCGRSGPTGAFGNSFPCTKPRG